MGERRGASLATRNGDGIDLGGGGVASPTFTMPFGVTFPGLSGSGGRIVLGAGVRRCSDCRGGSPATGAAPAGGCGAGTGGANVAAGSS
jgi:hypothetical protein